MARVHGDFFDDPTPTDVITFPHGEVLICPAVAEEQRHAYRRSLNEEILLYGIHGLLHLAGRRDDTGPGFRRMAREQEAILARVIRHGEAGASP
jgi:probable rRNA maturation factor